MRSAGGEAAASGAPTVVPLERSSAVHKPRNLTLHIGSTLQAFLKAAEPLP